MASSIRFSEEQQSPSHPGAHKLMQSDVIWVDGNLLPFENATVHLLNPTLHYGAGVFEGIHCYLTPNGPAIFRLRDHMHRFVNSALVLGLTDIGHTVDDLCRAAVMTVEANGFDDCYLRPMLYFEGPLGLYLDRFRPVASIAAWRSLHHLMAEIRQQGMRMTVSSFTRTHPNAGMTKGKLNGQYLNSLLAKTQASRAGFDEAVMLDPEGYVAECTTENLLLVRKGVLITPPRASILEGITRDTLLTLAHDAGYAVVEERISRDQLYIADEVFVCGTAAEVIGVREIDFRPIGDGQPGPVTRDLQQRYHDAVRGQTEHARDWLTYVTAGTHR